MFRVDFDRLFECRYGLFRLSGVDQRGTQVVIELPGLGRVELRRLLRFRRRLRELLQLAERYGEVTVRPRVRRAKFQRLAIGLDTLGHAGFEIRAAFLRRPGNVRLRQVLPHRQLLRIQFAGLGQADDGGVVILAFHGGCAGGVRVVQLLVLLHLRFAFFGDLLELLLVLLAHAAFLLFTETAAAGPRNRQLRAHGFLLLPDLLQVEVDRYRVAQPGAHPPHNVLFVTIHLYGDVIGAERQT